MSRAAAGRGARTVTVTVTECVPGVTESRFTGTVTAAQPARALSLYIKLVKGNLHPEPLLPFPRASAALTGVRAEGNFGGGRPAAERDAEPTIVQPYPVESPAVKFDLPLLSGS